MLLLKGGVLTVTRHLEDAGRLHRKVCGNLTAAGRYRLAAKLEKDTHYSYVKLVSF